jgi:shikimate kinase
MTDDPELRRKTIALVGLMGAGKTTIGRRLAERLQLPFRDADAEIELAAARSVSEIFQDLGENEFRSGEHRVIARLLGDAPHVLATGGGAYLHADTRALMRERAVTVWLKADLEVLARRVSRRDTRPLLRGKDPLQVLRAQAEARYPFYAQADVTVELGDASQQTAVEKVLTAVQAFSRARPDPGSGSAGPTTSSTDPRFAGEDTLQQETLEHFPVQPSREKL